MLACLIVAAGIVVHPTGSAPRRYRCRIELERRVGLEQRGVELTASRQEKREPLMCTRVAGIQLDGPAELALGAVPLPVVDEQGPGK